jgi:hypothetical protein
VHSSREEVAVGGLITALLGGRSVQRGAEAHFRAAQQNGAGVEDVNFGLAQALEMQGRWDEAAPLFAALVDGLDQEVSGA